MKIKPVIKAFLSIALTILVTFNPAFLLAESDLKKAISAAVDESAGELCSAFAGELSRCINDPDRLLENQDAQDPVLKKAMRMTHQLYTSAARTHLRGIPVALEKKYADEFFEGFFSESDNSPDLVLRMNRIVEKLQPAFTRKDLKVKIGILSGGGIMGFAKGGEWLVFTDEMAAWPEGEIAGVIAHEICHLQKRDFSKLILTEVLNRKVLASLPEPKLAQWKKLLNLFQARWQRFSEYETDVQAALMMKNAGINPNGLIKVLDRLKTGSEKPDKYLILDHPTSEERINALKKALAGTI